MRTQVHAPIACAPAPTRMQPEARREDAAEHACRGDTKSRGFLRTHGSKCIHVQRQEINMNTDEPEYGLGEIATGYAAKHACFLLPCPSNPPPPVRTGPTCQKCVYIHTCIYAYMYICMYVVCMNDVCVRVRTHTLKHERVYVRAYTGMNPSYRYMHGKMVTGEDLWAGGTKLR